MFSYGFTYISQVPFLECCGGALDLFEKTKQCNAGVSVWKRRRRQRLRRRRHRQRVLQRQSCSCETRRHNLSKCWAFFYSKCCPQNHTNYGRFSDARALNHTNSYAFAHNPFRVQKRTRPDRGKFDLGVLVPETILILIVS